MYLCEVLLLSLYLFPFINCEFVVSKSDQVPLCENDNGTYFDISNNGLQRIRKNFLQSPTVNCINLEGNDITEVEVGAFENSVKLHYLNLAKNRLFLDFLSSYEHPTVETLVLDEAFTGGKYQHERREDPPAISREYYDDYGNVSPYIIEPPRINLSISLQFPQLKHLYLRRNKFPSITIFSSSVPNITHLHLSENQISSVSFLQTFPKKLTHLYLDNNALTNFVTGSMENLQVLRIEHNPLSKICGNEYCTHGILFTNATNLRELSLSNTSLHTFDEEAMENMKNLKYLDISHNYLSKISRHALDNLTALIVLNLKQNKLTGVPEICNLKKLEVFDLSYNKIQNITHKTFCNSITLKSIHLGNNEIADIKPGIFDMLTSLTSLDLSWNKLITLPEYWFTVNRTQVGLQFLNLGGNPLKSIQLSSLKNLPETMKINFEPLSNNDTLCH